MVEALVRLARNFAIAQRQEEPLVTGQHDPYTKPDTGQAARSRLLLDGVYQLSGEALSTRLRQDGETAEVEVSFIELRHHTTDYGAVPLSDDRAGALPQLGGDPFSRFAKSARLGQEPAAVLLEGGSDRGGQNRCIADRRAAQDKGVAHAVLLA